MPGSFKESEEALDNCDMVRFLNNLYTEKDVKQIHFEMECGLDNYTPMEMVIQIINDLNTNGHPSCVRMAKIMETRKEEAESSLQLDWDLCKICLCYG